MSAEPPTWQFFLLAAFFILLCIGMLRTAIVHVRERHPAEVHMLWYIFSLSLCVCLLSFLAFPSLAPTDTVLEPDLDLGEIGKWAAFALRAATNVRDEATLIGVVFAVLVLPQILSFVLSGLFGCGSPPMMVKRITRMSILSITKFLSVYAGVMAASAVFAFFIRPSHFQVTTAPFMLVFSILFIMGSFLSLAFYHVIGELTGSEIGGARRVLRYMSRYREPEGAGKGGNGGEAHK
jgi:hypothetical protein